MQQESTSAPESKVPQGAAGPKQPVRLEGAYFDVAVCRNCAAAMDTPYCGQCGQKRARRLGWRDLRKETWEHWRLFELTSVQTLKRLLTHPGYVAREYVMGMRKKHMHPLKLLAFLVVILILVLARNSFFEYFHYSTRADAEVDRMAKLVQAYANWSFTTGIGAIFIASWSVYRRRLGYNSIEHLVLAVYCQILILAAIILALLPSMIWNDPASIRTYKAFSGYLLYGVKLAVVAVAFRQFFLVDLPREWPRLVASLVVYLAASWVLLRLYAYLVLMLVRLQLD